MNARTQDTTLNPAIELLRGVAALLVVHAHYWKLAGLEAGLTAFSYTGVDLFFVLSGFVFAPYFFGQPLRATPFFIRRFFRIYPVYCLGVVLYWLLAHGWMQGGWSLLAKHLLFLHTWENYQVAYSLNPAFWSLPPEVEFYLLLPLLARHVQGSRRVGLLFAVAVVLRLGLGWLSPPVPGVINGALILGFHLPGLLCEFLCGVMAWQLARATLATPVRAVVALAGLAGLLVLAAVATGTDDAAMTANGFLRGNVSLLAALCYMLMVGQVGALTVTGKAPLVLCSVAGSLSYGLYVFHNAARNVAVAWWGNGAVTAMLAFGMSVMVALVAHWLIEQPARSWGRAWSARMQARREG